MKKPNAGEVYKFVRGMTGPLGPLSTDSGRIAAVTLTGLSNITELTNLFDQYRVDWFEYTIHLQSATQNSTADREAFYPYLITAVDYNDSTVPVTANELLEYKNSEFFQFGPQARTYTRRIERPQPVVTMESGTANLGTDIWANTASTGLAWRGLKIWIQDFNSVSRNHVIFVTYRAGISCRVPK